MVTPRVLSLVCIRVTGGDDALTKQILDAVNATGKAYLTHNVVPHPATGANTTIIRVSIGTPSTTEADVRCLWDLLCAVPRC